MANKRTLKRNIDNFCEVLFAECVAASLYGNNKDGAESTIYSIVRMRNDFICRISHPEPGIAPKVYFKKMKEDFVAQAGELIDQINNL